MAVTKTPFLSLGAHGSIGNTLTAQKKGTATLLRAKPTPAYRQTLPQLYQRWLYEDYAYLWTQQTAAVKQSYATQGTRFHLTGFQQWLSYNLKHLPNIALLLHMDEKSGAVVTDFSKNKNNGIIQGASPTTGFINGGFYFDGINNMLYFPSVPSTEFTGNRTIELLLNLNSIASNQPIFSKGAHSTEKIYLQVLPNGTIDFITVKAAAQKRTYTAPGKIIWGTTYHLAVTLAFPTATIYLDGIDVTDTHDTHVQPNPTALVLRIGRSDFTAYWLKATLDHLIYYNRVLDLAEIKRHALRRYPV